MLLKYAPRLLVKHLAGRSGGGHASCTRFDGVVLFVDIVESTALTEDFGKSGSDGAERLATVLDEYFGRIIEIAEAYGGDTFKIDGDAVVILWYPEETSLSAPLPVVRAAAAALSIQREFRQGPVFAGVVLQNRMTLVAGRISFVVVSEVAGRSYAVVDGLPIRELGDPRLRGMPGQIVVSREAQSLLQFTATIASTPAGPHELLGLYDGVDDQFSAAPARTAAPSDSGLESRVRPFVPRVIVDRTAAGQSDWIAEFRKLTVIYVNLPGLDPSASDIAIRVQDAVRKIAAVVNPMGIPISNVVAGDKGFIVQIACVGCCPSNEHVVASTALDQKIESDVGLPVDIRTQRFRARQLHQGRRLCRP